MRVGKANARKWWKQKPIPVLLPEPGLLLGSAQHSKAPLDFKKKKKIYIFQPFVASTAELLLQGKAFPKRRFSSQAKGWWLGWSRRKVASAGSPSRAMPPPSSLPGDQRTPTELLSGFGTCFFVALGWF